MEFLKIWEVLSRRKKVFIIAFSVFFSSVAIGTNLITPSYKASAKLYINETSNILPSILSSVGLKGISVREKGRSGSLSKEKLYQTDIELVKIEPLLGKLISSLNLKGWRGKAMRPDKLVESGIMHKLKCKILPRPYIKVDQYEDADMIEIVSYSSNSYEAANMSNKLAKLYIRDRLKSSRKMFRTARSFIESQIQKVKDEYYDSLSALNEFKIKEKTVDLGAETTNLLDKIASLKSNYEDNEKVILESIKKIERSKEKLKAVEKFRKESEQFSKSDSVISLQTKLNDLLVSLSQKSVDFTKEHPGYKQIEKQVETVRELIKNEAEKAFDSETISIDPGYDYLLKNTITAYIDHEVAVTKKGLIQTYLNEYQNELLKIPKKNAESSKLELALSVKKNMYQSLLEYLNQVGIMESINLSNIKLVQAASVPYKIYFPQKKLNYMIGLFLGLFWGLIVTFFFEYIDNTIKTPEDVKKIKSLSLLGTIPKSKYLQKLNTISNLVPDSAIIEAYRTIKNNIRYASVNKPTKTLLLTSSIDCEGKSCTASNISITYCMEDKRVLLVDLNLRKPSIHKFFNIPNNKGITNTLSEGLPLEDVIVHTGIKGLDLLLSGPIPVNPSKLVESQGIKDSISKLRNLYDMIIIDTPSVIAVNDAITIGAVTDGVLYIVESGKTTFAMVEHVKELFAKAGLQTMGMVLNKFKPYEASYYRYYYNRSFLKR